MPATSTAKKAPTKKATAKAKVSVKTEQIHEEKVEVAPTNKIAMQFSIDPDYPPEHQFFEIMINGVSYCYPRGEVVEVPREIFDIVKTREENYRRSKASYAAYTRPEGANIT